MQQGAWRLCCKSTPDRVPAGQQSSGTRQIKKWTETDLLSTAKDNLTPEAYTAFQSLLTFSKEHADTVSFGNGVVNGSFGPIVESICPRSVFTVRTDGVLKLNFEWLPDDFTDTYFNKMQTIGLPLSAEDKHRYPTLQAEEWVSRVDSLINAFKEILNHR